MAKIQKDYAELIEEMYQTKNTLAGILGSLKVQVESCRKAREFLYQDLVVKALEDTNAKLEKIIYKK